MTISKSNIANILLGIACLVMGYFLFFNEKPLAYDPELIKQQKEAIQRENEILLKSINNLSKKNTIFEAKIDSLQKEKTKTETQYGKIYKKIDTYSNAKLVNQFDSVFAANNVR